MSKMFFNRSTVSFYPEDMKEDYIAGVGWPDDAVEITLEQWTTYTQAPPPGKFLSSGDDGMPAWADLPPLSKEQNIAAAEQERQSLLNHANAVTADWRTELALGIISDDDKAALILWMKYIKDVKAVDTSTAPDIDWPTTPQ